MPGSVFLFIQEAGGSGRRCPDLEENQGSAVISHSPWANYSFSSLHSIVYRAHVLQLASRPSTHTAPRAHALLRKDSVTVPHYGQHFRVSKHFPTQNASPDPAGTISQQVKAHRSHCRDTESEAQVTSPRVHSVLVPWTNSTSFPSWRPGSEAEEALGSRQVRGMSKNSAIKINHILTQCLETIIIGEKRYMLSKI